jgi:hypothetical protein
MPLKDSPNTGWPETEWYFSNDYLAYDWYSGLWEVTPEATVRFGFGEWGSWVHLMWVPQCH